MPVSDLALSLGASPRTADDNDAPPHPTVWPHYRLMAIALPIFMAASYFSQRHDSPPTLGHLSPTTWLLLCLAGAVTSVATFGLALRLSERWPVVGDPSWTSAGVHLLAIFGCSALDALARAIVSPRSPIPVPEYSTLAVLASGAAAYLILSLGCQGFRTIRDAKQAEAARMKLRAELVEAGQRRAEAELRALKAELNPHFLGNALQGVKALMRSDVDAAQHLLSPLADLLRTTLTRASTQETTLREEIEALRPFIDVERARLRGRLDVQFEIEESTLDLLVPDMILQPLVENAVKHGLVSFGGGRIHITAHRAWADDEYLELLVEDDGVALGSVGTTRSSRRGGVGLANIRSRLAELYANHASLELTRGGIGTLVRVTLPLRDADTAEPRAIDSADDASALAESANAASRVRFTDHTWSGRASRMVTMAATIALWFNWTMRNVAGNAQIAFAKGYDDKRLYSIVDGVIVGTMMVGMVYFAFWVSRRVALTVHGARSTVGVTRVLIVSVASGVAYAIVLCLAKVGAAFAFQYWEILQPSHMAASVPKAIISLDLLFLITCVVAQSYYAGKGSLTARRARRSLSSQLDNTRRCGADAELRALKSELNPHFIGNALTAVSVLMRTDIAAASRVIDQLSDLLRTAVDHAATQEVTLREELESLQPFLAVERIRLGRDLAVSLKVDEQTLDGRVPHMILQPLVENAVKHGFALRAAGHIEVHAQRDERHLELRIYDDGDGLSSAAAAPMRRGGTGLANARARLSKLYGQSASLELSSVPEGGAMARLLIPWHETESFTPLTFQTLAAVPLPFSPRPASTAGAVRSP